MSCVQQLLFDLTLTIVVVLRRMEVKPILWPSDTGTLAGMPLVQSDAAVSDSHLLLLFSSLSRSLDSAA